MCVCVVRQELDLTSTFVSKARSKLEQKPKAEREKKTAAGEKVCLRDGKRRPRRLPLTAGVLL